MPSLHFRSGSLAILFLCGHRAQEGPDHRRKAFRLVIRQGVARVGDLFDPQARIELLQLSRGRDGNNGVITDDEQQGDANRADELAILGIGRGQNVEGREASFQPRLGNKLDDLGPTMSVADPCLGQRFPFTKLSSRRCCSTTSLSCTSRWRCGLKNVGSARMTPRMAAPSRLATIAAVRPPMECPSNTGAVSPSPAMSPTTSLARFS